MIEIVGFFSLLLALNALFSISEFSIVSSRKIRLEQMAAEGNSNASLVLELSQRPNAFITVIQVSLNIIAILAGIYGDESFAPHFKSLLSSFSISDKIADLLSTSLSVLLITSVFIVFSELIPKRIAFSTPEVIACKIIRPLLFVLMLLKPFVWVLSKTADFILNLLGVSSSRNEQMTFEEVSAVIDEGAKTGLLEQKEHTLIANVFSLTDRSVLSAMTTKNDVIFLDINDDKEKINQKILIHPHSRFLVCDTELDNLLGYIESTKLLINVLQGQNQQFDREKLKVQGLKSIVTIPDTLTLLEVLDKFREYREDIAAVVNEFGNVVGLITLNDVMSTIMGNVLLSENEEASFIVKRAENSWLIDGKASIEDVKNLFEWDDMPGAGNYETISGFLMYMMKCIPKKAQSFEFNGVLFEIVDVDGYRIDEVMATKKL
jgi:CBS domain containing-hemolysin-like protein